MLPAWTPAIIIRLLGREPTKGDDWQDVRQKIVGGIDGFGLTAPESATLHTLKNTESIKISLTDLVTPRPGEKDKLDKILSLLETIASLSRKIIDGHADLSARLAGVELQIIELQASSMHQSSSLESTTS
jgi:hypothetical protein